MGYIRTAVKIIVIIRIYRLFSQSIVFVFLLIVCHPIR